MAAALVDGRVGPEQFNDSRLTDEDMLSQADKVKLVADDEAGALASSKGMRSCRITIKTNDGNVFETFVGHPRGAPENPMSEEELSSKFVELATMALGRNRAQGVLSDLNTLENISSLRRIIDKLRP